MRYRRSLRFRLVLSYFVLSGVIGGILLFILFFSLETIEEQLVNEHVLDELAYFHELSSQNSNITSLHTKKLRGIRLVNGEVLNDYPFLNALNPGLHHITHNEEKYVIGVETNNNISYYMLYDVTHFEAQENLLISVFIIAVLAAVIGIVWYGYTVTDKLIAPVTTLAKQVRNLSVTNHQPELSKSYAKDEVGELARSFDIYKERIEQFLERERNFTSDASHELRTPLAVVQGAVELLLEHNELTESIRRPLLRIDRAAHEMQQNLAALLYLARETSTNENNQGWVDIAEVARSISNELQEVLQKQAITMVLTQHAEPKINTSKSLIRVLLSNLIRNAFNYCNEGQVSIIIDDKKVMIKDTGIGISKQDLPHITKRGYRGVNIQHEGGGLGLSIVKRICDRFGWELSITSEPGKGTCVTWKFK